jgi:Ca2+/Na+ antiporter
MCMKGRGNKEIQKMLKKGYSYFSYKNISENVVAYGYEYPIKYHIETMVLMIIITFITGLFYQLDTAYIAIIIFTGLVCVPKLISVHFSNKYKQRRFNDVDIYIHQMAYSFQRQPKISTALEDTYKIASKDLKECIGKALDELQYDNTDKVYERALGVIENEYDNSRVTTLHKFLINIEKKGGSYSTSLSVLLMDFDNWVKNVYKHQQDIKRVKTNLAIGLILSFFLASVSVIIAFILKNTSEIQLDITKNLTYQICSTVFIILCLIFYVYTRCAFNDDWVKLGRDDNKIIKDYKVAFHTKVNTIQRKMFPVCVVMLVVALALLIAKRYVWSIVLFLFAVYIMYVPKLNIKNARNRINEDVYRGFSDWLRDVAINLQEEPLMMAIENTYNTCPVVIKESLEEFIYEIESNPSDVEPYYNFMSRFGILDISSMVRTLYSLSELSIESADDAINSLIKRNYELMDKHEADKNKDTISTMKFAEYIPTVFVSFKIAIDMMLVVSNYL